MKKKQTIKSNLQSMSKSLLSSIKGGNKEKEEEEYRIIYINGKPYRIRKDKDGNPTSIPEELF